MQARKRKLLQNQKLIDLDKNLPIFSALSNVDLENLNLSITTNIKDLLASLIQQIRENRFSKSSHQMYEPKIKL